MKKEFLSVLAQLEREKGIDKNILIEAIKQALAIAAKKIVKITSQDAEARVEIDPEKEISMFTSAIKK